MRGLDHARYRRRGSEKCQGQTQNSLSRPFFLGTSPQVDGPLVRTIVKIALIDGFHPGVLVEVEYCLYDAK